MKKVFIKTVLNDYSSLYARGQLGRTYKIGEQFKFPEELPAHVGHELGDYASLHDAWYNRPEPAAYDRVLLCYGEIKERDVPVLPLQAVVWEKTFLSLEEAYYEKTTSTDFIVIGEIFVPESWRRNDRLRNNCKELAISEDLTNTL